MHHLPFALARRPLGRLPGRVGPDPAGGLACPGCWSSQSQSRRGRSSPQQASLVQVSNNHRFWIMVIIARDLARQGPLALLRGHLFPNRTWTRGCNLTYQKYVDQGPVRLARPRRSTAKECLR